MKSNGTQSTLKNTSDGTPAGPSSNPRKKIDRISYDFHRNFVRNSVGAFLGILDSGEFRTNFIRISYEIRPKRIHVRSNFVRNGFTEASRITTWIYLYTHILWEIQKEIMILYQFVVGERFGTAIFFIRTVGQNRNSCPRRKVLKKNWKRISRPNIHS